MSRPPSPPVRSVLPTVIVDFALAYLGYFLIMPILPLALAATFHGESATWTGIALGALALAMRGGSLFVTGWMHRSSVRTAIAVGLFLVALGFFATAMPLPHPVLVVTALAVAGLGMSINSVAVRSHVAIRVRDRAEQNTVFSVIQVIVNVAAALGPIGANLLLGSGAFTYALLGSSALFIIAAISVPLTVPRSSQLAEGATRAPQRRRLIHDLLADPSLRRISTVVLVGGFLYGQFFSSLAILINRSTEQPLLRAGFYTLNALLVVVAQLPVATLVNRAMGRRTSALQVLVVGVVVMGLSFGLVATGGSVLTAYLAIAVFSLGETLYTPMVNTAFVDASHGRPVVEAFNMRQLATAIGESLGAFAGGWLYLEAVSSGAEPVYWASLAVLAILTLPMLRPQRQPERATAASSVE